MIIDLLQLVLVAYNLLKYYLNKNKMKQNSNKCKIVILNPIDDVNNDGTANIWWFRDGSDLNIEYKCSCIYEMFNSKQLFSLIFSNEPVLISKTKLLKFCTEVK